MRQPSSIVVVSRAFAPSDLIAGHAAFDFVNTVTAWNGEVARDWLDGYARVLEWSRLAHVLDERTATRLGAAAAQSPAAAGKALMRLKALRAALYATFGHVLLHKRPPPDALACVERAWQDAQARMRLDYADGGAAPRLDVERSALDLPRDRLAVMALELLQQLPANRARICRGDQCGWLFLDTSKGGRRVWCDMATCGNAAKTRRHQRKLRAAPKRRRDDGGHPGAA